MHGPLTSRELIELEPSNDDGFPSEVDGDTAARAAGEWKRLYLTVEAKFALSVAVAVLWTGLSVWLSQRWLSDLAAVAGWVVAVVAITFIAYAWPHRRR